MSEKKRTLISMDPTQVMAFAVTYALKEAISLGRIQAEVGDALPERIDELVKALYSGQVLSPDAAGNIRIFSASEYKEKFPEVEDTLLEDEADVLVIGPKEGD